MSDSEATEYYMLESDVEDEMLLENMHGAGGGSWFSGQRFRQPVAEPISLNIMPGYEEDTLPACWQSSVPMMRDDLIAFLRAHGVDNIDAYRLEIRNKKTGEVHQGYCAVNIIGLVSAADPARTEYSPDNPSRLIDADIDSLAIDPQRTHEQLLFRLAECVTGVAVHKRIKHFVEASGKFPDLRFVLPKDWIG